MDFEHFSQNGDFVVARALEECLQGFLGIFVGGCWGRAVDSILLT